MRLRLEQRSPAWSSVRARALDAVDNDELQRAARRLQLQTELVLQRGQDAASRIVRDGRYGLAGPPPTRVLFRQPQIEIVGAGQPGTIDDGAPGELRQHPRQRRQPL